MRRRMRRGAYRPAMGEATLVFDPFSQAFFDDPYEFYRWMRTEAPVYYSDQYDFYALTRHDDVAAAYKNYETYSSAYGVDLAMVQAGGPPPEVRLLQFMDPPEHRQMRSVLNKLFTPRAIQLRQSMITAVIDNAQRSQIFAMVRNQMEGGRPFNPADLKAQGASWQTNVNFGDAQAAAGSASWPKRTMAVRRSSKAIPIILSARAAQRAGIRRRY